MVIDAIVDDFNRQRVRVVSWVFKVIEHLGTIPENTNFGIKANIVSNLLASNNITTGAPNTKAVSKSKLGKTVSNATYYLSCWMTMAQIQKMQSQ